MLLESTEDRHQFGVDLREVTLQCIEILGVSYTRNDVFALGIHQKVAVGLVFTCCCVTCETNSGSGVAVTIAKHHGLNVDSGAKFVTDLLANAISDCSRSIP